MRKDGYKQLTLEERDRIHLLLWDKCSIRDIARQLGRHPSTISREIDRNTPPIKRRYTPHLAQEKYAERKRLSRQRPRLKDPRVVEYFLHHLIVDHWSPETIANCWNKQHRDGIQISHESLYQYIYSLGDPGEPGDLRPYLRRRHKRRRRKHIPFKELRKQRIPNRIPIDDRPKSVSKRRQFGHWEGDLVESQRGSNACLQTLVERKSRVVRISKVHGKTSEESIQSFIRQLRPLPKGLRRTLTLDNGRENAKHEEVTSETEAVCYFAHPYHSWERGTNENTNGLIRWYFPKGTDFANVTEQEIKHVEDLLNNRPRKCLNYQTPNQVFLRGVALTS